MSAQWKAAWDRTFAELGQGGTRIVGIADTPYMGGSVPECLGKPANEKNIGHCMRTQTSSLRGPEQRAVFLSYATTGPISVVNPVGWFCSDQCPAVIGNVLVYRDSNHMTTTYSRILAPLLDASLGPQRQ